MCGRVPVALLVVAVALLTAMIQSGELGTADTTRRLQVTHSLWTSAPQVTQADYAEFGSVGRGGRIYAWYGVGQSLLMLPADMVGTAAAHAPWWRGYVQSRATPQIRGIVVSVTTNVLLNVLTALIALRFLELLGFSRVQSIAGTLALICATTHLHYAQNMQENNYIFLLTLTGLWLQLRWAETGEWRGLWLGAGALGLNLLTRDHDGSGCGGCVCLSAVDGEYLLVRLVKIRMRAKLLSVRESEGVSAHNRAGVCGVYISGPALSVFAVRVMDDHVHAFAGGSSNDPGPYAAEELSIQRALASGRCAFGTAGPAA